MTCAQNCLAKWRVKPRGVHCTPLLSGIVQLAVNGTGAAPSRVTCRHCTVIGLVPLGSPPPHPATPACSGGEIDAFRSSELGAHKCACQNAEDRLSPLERGAESLHWFSPVPWAGSNHATQPSSAGNHICNSGEVRALLFFGLELYRFT